MALPDRMQMALDKLAMGGYSAPQQQPALSAEFGGKKWEYATPQQVAAAHPAQDVTARPGVVSTAQGGFAEGGTLYGPMLKKPATVQTAQTQPATSQPATPQNPFTAMMPGAGRVRAFDDYISNLPPVQRKAAVAAIQNNPGMADVMQGSKFVRQYGIAQLTGIEPGDPKALEEQRRKDFHIWQTGYDANVAKLKEQGKLDDARKLTLQKIAQFNPDTVGITDPRQLGIIRQLKEAATNPVPSLDPDTAWKQIDEIVQRHVTGDMTERERVQMTEERAQRAEELKQQDTQMQARESQLKLAATAQQKRVDRAKSTLDDLMARWKEADKSVREAQEKASTSNEQDERARWSGQIASREQERQAIQKDIDKAKTELATVQADYDSANANIEKFYGEAAQANQWNRGGSDGSFLDQAPAQPQQTASAEPTATNPKTGQKLVYRNGQWVPA